MPLVHSKVSTLGGANIICEKGTNYFSRVVNLTRSQVGISC